MIVAELGVNWSWATLPDRMKRVRDTGAQWVKGQLFYPDMVPERFHPIALYDRGSIDRWKDAARNADLIPIFTPMHIDLVRFCDRGHIKIRHKDKDDRALIRASEAMASNVWVSGKNVFCVPKYPASAGDYVNPAFPHVGKLGVSWHVPSVESLFNFLNVKVKGSVWVPMSYIEAHIKFSEDDYEAAWSLNCEDFKRLVEWEQKG